MIDYTAVASRTFRTNEARIVFPGKCKTNTRRLQDLSATRLLN